ncbi:MAG: hypothetical protein ACOYT4_03510 [Nanoarchaeota archaeon]
MTGTISDWIISGDKQGFSSINDYHTNKFEDYLRLKKSGLPTFEDYITPIEEFKDANVNLKRFLDSHKTFTVRAIPNTKELPRRYKIGVKNFEECISFLEKNIEGNRNNYTVFLTEYERNKYSGIIISNSQKVLIEIGQGNLDELSHGKDPLITCRINLDAIGHMQNKIEWIRYNEQNKDLILRSLKYLELNHDHFNPLYRRGYFEFIITEGDKIKFLDFKTNENYLI